MEMVNAMLAEGPQAGSKVREQKEPRLLTNCLNEVARE